MKPTLTPEQKEQKRQRDVLVTYQNRLKMSFSMGRIKTWEDWVKESGQGTSAPLNQVFTKDDLLLLLKLQTAELEDKQNETNPSRQTSNVQELRSDKTVGTNMSKVADAQSHIPLHPEPQLAGESTSDINDDIEENNADNDYGLHKSPNENVFLFWFQKKAVKELYDGFTKHKLRGQLLLANTGTGKTFMAGALLRRLIDDNFHEGKTWSPIPYLYITRASVVEQTRRVFATNFNIGVEYVEVINIEALRSSVGRLWVKEEMIIEQGKEVYKWTWKKNINPCIVLLDECQSVKNPDSTQSEIMISYADLATKDNHVLFISATPFTRVSEAKVLVVNCHHESQIV